MKVITLLLFVMVGCSYGQYPYPERQSMLQDDLNRLSSLLGGAYTLWPSRTPFPSELSYSGRVIMGAGTVAQSLDALSQPHRIYESPPEIYAGDRGITVVPDRAGNTIMRIQTEGRIQHVYDGEWNTIGYVTKDGTFDSNWHKVSDSQQPALLLIPRAPYNTYRHQ